MRFLLSLCSGGLLIWLWSKDTPNPEATYNVFFPPGSLNLDFVHYLLHQIKMEGVISRPFCPQALAFSCVDF